MVGWHHRLNGHEFEQIPVDGEGQESLACCSLWGYKELDMTQQMNNMRKKGNPDICDKMDGPWSIMLSEVSQTEKDKYWYSIT